MVNKTKTPRLVMETCLSASENPHRSKIVDCSDRRTTRGYSLWVKGISEPRVRDTRVRDTAFRVVISVVSYRVMLSIWWVMVTISHDVLIPEG